MSDKQLTFSLYFGENDEVVNNIVIPMEGLNNIAKAFGSNSFSDIEGEFFEFIFVDEFVSNLESDRSVHLDIYDVDDGRDGGDYVYAYRVLNIEVEDALQIYDLTNECKRRLSSWSSLKLEIDKPMTALLKGPKL